MKQIIVTILALLALSVTGFSQQQTYHLKSTDQSYQKITFEAEKGTGLSVKDIEVKVEWNLDENYFTVHFKNEDKVLNKDKYIYLFPKMEKMSKVKKVDKGLWFDRMLKKQSKENGVAVVYGYYNGNSKEENIQMFDLGKEDSFELKFTETDEITIKPNATCNFKLYVYIANNTWRGARNRKVCYVDIVDFKIELVAPCADSLITKKIEQCNNELQEVETLITNLEAERKKLSSSNVCSMSEKSSKSKETINNDFTTCDTYTSVINNLNSKIEEYNEKVISYNKTLKDLQKKCKKPVEKCDCDCTALKKGVENKLGPLFVELSQNKIDKKVAQEKLNTIKQSSITCVGSCKGKDCNTICSTQCKDAYKTFQDYCSKIEKLLK